MSTKEINNILSFNNGLDYENESQYDTAPLPYIEDTQNLDQVLSSLQEPEVKEANSIPITEDETEREGLEDLAKLIGVLENEEVSESNSQDTLQTDLEATRSAEDNVQNTKEYKVQKPIETLEEPSTSVKSDKDNSQPEQPIKSLFLRSQENAQDKHKVADEQNNEEFSTKENQADEKNLTEKDISNEEVKQIQPILSKETFGTKEKAIQKNPTAVGRKRILIALAVLAALLAGVYAWGYFYYKDHFLPNTYISGFNMSNKTLDEAAETLASANQERKVTIKGKDGVESVLNASQVGLELNESANIPEALENQDTLQWPKNLLVDNSVYIESGHEINEQALEQTMASLPIVSGPQIVPTQNAQGSYNGSEFVIKDEVYGTQVDSAKLKESIEHSLLTGDDVINLEEDGLYVMPSIKKDNSTLIDSVNKLNTAVNTVVTYDFKASQEVLDKNTFAGWLSTNEKGEAVLDSAQVASYISGLAEKYDTLGKPVSFTTSYGNQIEFEDWYKGWEIDQEQEEQQLEGIIMAGQPVTREPVYSTTGRDRTQPNAITGTYLEISIGDQTMWYYLNGELIVSTPVVTGDVLSGYGTPTGLYELYSKSTNVTLTGENADGSEYASPVTFWLPFNGGIGVHDASWRGSYGGNIFRGNGSHGCVNTPYGAVSTIYDNISVGDPVVVY